MKLSSYFVLSTFLAIGNLAHAFITYEQFYPAVIHLSGDKLSRVILYNFTFVLFSAFSLATLRFFIGTLRDLEVEQLIDTGRGFLADTILFLVFYSPTVDGKEVDTAYLVQFICRIIFMKVFHLIVQIRVSHMFEVGLPRFWVNVKLFSLMALLLLYDMVTLRVYYTLATRNSTFYAWIVFEALTMAVMLVTTLCKYLIHIVDLRLENGWPAKSAYLFYVDLIGDVANMILFLIFMLACVVQNPTRLPIYMMADVVQVARQLTMRLKAFKKYRAITANMDHKFPNATAEELEKADSCIICRDTLGEGSKKLPCSHVFHLDCLKNWVVMQQSCPTCRADIPANPPPLAPVAADAAEVPAPAAVPAAPASASAAQPARATPCAPGTPSAAANVTTRVASQLSAELENFFSNEIEPDISLQELSSGIAHAQKMATYMRSQQEFWMKQVDLLGGDTNSIIGISPPGELPVIPTGFDSALTRISTIAPKSENTSVPASGRARTVTSQPATSSMAEDFASSCVPETVSKAVASETVSKAVSSETVSKAVASETVSKAVASETVSKAVASETQVSDVDAVDVMDSWQNEDANSQGTGDEELRKLRELQRSKWQAQNSK